MPARLSILPVILLFTFHRQSYSSDLKHFDKKVGVLYANRHFFYWNAAPNTWYGAKSKCQEQGAFLATITDQNINNFLFVHFFQQSVLLANSFMRKEYFSKKRREPPDDHMTSDAYNMDVAWADGTRVQKGFGEGKWLHSNGKLFGYTRFGTGYDSNKWNCLSVKPANDYTVRYDLFWYGTDCRTRLPFICQVDTQPNIISIDKNTNSRHNVVRDRNGDTERSSTPRNLPPPNIKRINGARPARLFSNYDSSMVVMVSLALSLVCP